MVIKELPKEIQKLVFKRQKENYDENCEYTLNFNWTDSKEGRDFWSKILLKNNYEPFYEKYPLVFEENTAYHCETEEEFNELLKYADSVGYECNSIKGYDMGWDIWEDESCYSIYDDTLCSLDQYTEEGYKIIKASDALKKLKGLHNASYADCSINSASWKEIRPLCFVNPDRYSIPKQTVTISVKKYLVFVFIVFASYKICNFTRLSGFEYDLGSFVVVWILTTLGWAANDLISNWFKN